MTVRNITNLLAQVAPIAIMAPGITFALLVGVIDLSLGAIGKIITQDRTISLGLSVSPLRVVEIEWIGKFPVLLFVVSAVLGGTSLLGGRGSFFPGSFIGALILLFISSRMGIMGISPYTVPFVRGVIIFITMYIDSLR